MLLGPMTILKQVWAGGARVGVLVVCGNIVRMNIVLGFYDNPKTTLGRCPLIEYILFCGSLYDFSFTMY